MPLLGALRKQPIDGRFQMDVQTFIGAPHKIGHASLKTPLLIGPVVHAQGKVIRQMDSAVQRAVLHGAVRKPSSQGTMFDLLAPAVGARHLEIHAAAVGEPHPPLVVHRIMQGQVTAERVAASLKGSVTVDPSLQCRQHTRMRVQFHVRAGHFRAKGQRQTIRYLERDIRVDGQGLQAHVHQTGTARPGIWIAVAQTGTGEYPHPQPGAVAHLMSHIKVRNDPGFLFNAGGRIR